MKKFIPLLAILLLGCSALYSVMDSSSAPPDPIVTITGSYEAVIFPADYAEAEQIGSWAINNLEGYWSPTETDVAELEAGLAEFLENSGDERLSYYPPPVWERLSDYRRQYFGYFTADGQQVLYGNFFCDGGEDYWQQYLVEVADGGNCFFQIKYDMASREFFSLSVNGEA